MKNCKKILSVILVASMAFSLAGCSSIKAISKKDFKNALKELKLDDDIIDRDYKDSKDDMEYSAYAFDDDQYYMFYQFEDAEAAHDYFEDEIYDDAKDAKEDKEIDGKFKMKLSKTSGYVIINGENDGDDIWEADYLYGGFYLKDDIIVVAMTTSDKKSDIKDVQAFLKEIGYPKP